MSRIKTVVLDIGNVVLQISGRKMLKAMAPDADVDDLFTRFATWEAFDAFERGAIDEAEFQARVEELLGKKFSRPDFHAAWNEVFIGPVEGIETVMQQIAERVPLHALSNANRIHIDFATATYECLAHFKTIHTSYDLRCRKPEREIYERLCAKLGVAPNEVLFFDDLLENVEGARQAGLHAEHCVKSAETILDIVKKLKILP